MTNNPMTAAEVERLMMKAALYELFTEIMDCNGSVAYADASDLACDTFTPAILALTGEIRRLRWHTERLIMLSPQIDHKTRKEFQWITEARQALADSAEFAKIGEVVK